MRGEQRVPGLWHGDHGGDPVSCRWAASHHHRWQMTDDRWQRPCCSDTPGSRDPPLRRSATVRLARGQDQRELQRARQQTRPHPHLVSSKARQAVVRLILNACTLALTAVAPQCHLLQVHQQVPGGGEQPPGPPLLLLAAGGLGVQDQQQRRHPGHQHHPRLRAAGGTLHGGCQFILLQSYLTKITMFFLSCCKECSI